MRAGTLDLSFRPLTVGDLPLLYEWRARPHVAEWWGGAPASLAELEADYAGALVGTAPQWCYLVCEGSRPVGFIQAYAPVGFHEDAWWLDEHDPGVRGFDVLLADANRLGRGLGTAIVRAFVARLFADASVTRVQADPDPANHRAVRCYEKADFRAAREIDTPDGPALLMYCERPSVLGEDGQPAEQVG